MTTAIYHVVQAAYGDGPGRGVPDRLPVTTHHVMPYFLERYMPGTGTQEFFD